jgi:hypothetical protein
MTISFGSSGYSRRIARMASGLMTSSGSSVPSGGTRPPRGQYNIRSTRPPGARAPPCRHACSYSQHTRPCVIRGHNASSSRTAKADGAFVSSCLPSPQSSGFRFSFPFSCLRVPVFVPSCSKSAPEGPSAWVAKCGVIARRRHPRPVFAPRPTPHGRRHPHEPEASGHGACLAACLAVAPQERRRVARGEDLGSDESHSGFTTSIGL